MKKNHFLRKHINNWSEELLGQYFQIDHKELTAELYFDTFSELIDQNIGDNQVEKLNSTLFEKLDEIFELIPRKYHIHIHVKIRDFGNYTVEEAEHILYQNIALKIYGLMLENRRKHITGLSLLSGGVLMLIASYFLSDLNWPQIIFDVINISGTLFVWEAADIVLIERSANTKHAKQYISKFKELKLLKE